MKLQKTLIVATFLYFSSLACFSYGDIIELKNGQTLQAVITSENETTYTAHLNVGTVTVSKENVIRIQEQTKQQNQEMIARWEQAEIRKTDPEVPVLTPATTEAKAEIRYLRYGDTWVTEKEFKELQSEKKMTWEEKVQAEKKRLRKLQEIKLEEQLGEKTEKLIIQGSKRRSEDANRILANYEWKHKKTDHCLIFYQNSDLGILLKEKTEFFTQRIAADLEIRDEIDDELGRLIEVYGIDDKEVWLDLLRGRYLPDSPNAFSKVYKKEIFLFAENDHDVEYSLPHELGHMLLRFYTYIKFGRQALVPLWLGEGFANFEGNIINLSAAEKMLEHAVQKNTQFRLPELVVIRDYPEEADAKILFYVQSTKFVQFLFFNFGREIFLDFSDAFLDEYNKVVTTKKELTTNDGRELLKRALDRSSLRKEFHSIASLEEAWLKSIFK